MKESPKNDAHSGLVRVVFPLGEKSWHGYETERLWAQPLPGNRYRLRNSPFYAIGVSAEDVVFASSRSDGSIEYTGVSLHAGHSTYRLFSQYDITSSEFLEFWSPVQKLGCTYEQASPHLLSVDVPPQTNVREVYALLQAGEEAKVWEFEEGHCGHDV